MAGRNVVLLLAAAAVAALPMIFTLSDGPEFAGADDQAKAMIQQIRPDYEPWFSSVWEPPSGEVQSLLFALQAALGAGFLGYYFGLRRARAEVRRGEGSAPASRSHAAH